MGIVNVTPDSFSDGGRFFQVPDAIAQARKLIEEGADIVDVGGESTRPGAEPVSEAEEMRRVMPVLEAVAARSPASISIDTMKPGVARAALKVGACMINDVAANRTDPEMWRLAAESGAGYICMHMQGTPRTMQSRPSYSDVVAEVALFFCDRIKRMSDCGMGAEQIILDPGIGFGKTVEHNLRLLAGLSDFARFERPVAIGASRKSFLGQPTAGHADPTEERCAVSDRLAAGLACACLAVEAGAQIIRTHDVLETVRALRVAEAILARRTVL